MTPTRKTAAGGVAGAATVIICGIVEQFTDITIGAVFGSAMTTLIGFAASYFMPSPKEKK